jgi:P27 family predicted phage terminase small subunit
MPRKVVPTKLKIVKGTFRADRANPNEPVYSLEIPEPPDHLNKIGRIEWDRMSKVFFDQGLLSQVDMACLASYCQLFGRWSEAETDLKKSTLLIKTTSGNIIQNPLLGIANTALKLMNKCLLEFGMTPASRSKVSAKKSKKKADPWADFGAPKKIKKLKKVKK